MANNPLLDGAPPMPAATSPTDFASLLQQAYAARIETPGKSTALGVAATPAQPVDSASRSMPAVVPSSAGGGALVAVGRAYYTPAAMVELMLVRPDFSHAQLCSHFGRPASWMASVLASEAFQRALDPHRDQIVDPSLSASLHERYKALAIRTSNVLMTKMDAPEVTDFLVLKAGEIAMKALGMGTKTEAAPATAAPAPATDSLAERLIAALDKRDGKRTVDVEAEEVSPDGNV